MAVFTQTCIDIDDFGGGFVIERGTWSDANSDGTGNITATDPTTGSFSFPAEIGTISLFCFSSNGDNEVIAAQDVSPGVIKITCTAGDAGTYCIIGKAS